MVPHEYEMTLRHPATGALTEGKLTIVGENSHEFYNATKDALRNRNILSDEFEVLDDDNIQAYAACIKDWTESFFEMPCNAKNVNTVLSDPLNGWIKAQVEAAILNKGHFFRTEE